CYPQLRFFYQKFRIISNSQLRFFFNQKFRQLVLQKILRQFKLFFHKKQQLIIFRLQKQWLDFDQEQRLDFNPKQQFIIFFIVQKQLFRRIFKILRQ
ncbi:MAG: hypothetical protein VZR12_00135, partial [Candidatus Cryptobacteroides sp.]|nr:hypothetical protein [Candidatus Cryptobacteroides sp.]